MSELKQFKLPDVGEGLTEADIVKWHVKPGDTVTVNQTIVEIETAKAVVELPSPFAGVVSGLLVPEGQTVDVGTPIVSIDVSGGPGQGPAGATEPAPSGEARGGAERRGALARDLVPSPPAGGEAGPAAAGRGADEAGPAGGRAHREERQPVLVGYGVKLGTAKRRPRKTGQVAGPGTAAPARPGAAAPAAVPSPGPAGGTGAAMPSGPAGSPAAATVTVLAKPPVRKLARELGVDLAGVAGTGPGGSVTRADVQAAAQAPAGVPAAYEAAGGPAAATAGEPLPAAVAPAAMGTGPREERVAVRGVRKHTAAAVAASAFTAPHVTEFLQVDATETMEATRRIRDLPEFAGVRVSPLLLLARALLIAVARHPMINSSWDDAAQEIVVKRYVNLGVAAATERGLIVPNIKDAHLLTLPALARALADIAGTARAGRTTPADLRDGTITITNVGVFGVDSGTPILTPGEAAILAFGQIRDMPWVHGGELAVREVCTLALSFDHRIVDGDLGSAVLRDVGAMLQEPVRLVAWG